MEQMCRLSEELMLRKVEDGTGCLGSLMFHLGRARKFRCSYAAAIYC